MLAYNEHDPFYVFMIQRWLKQGTFGRKGWGREKKFENLTFFSFINMRLELSQGNLLHAYGYRICFLKQDVGKLEHSWLGNLMANMRHCQGPQLKQKIE